MRFLSQHAKKLIRGSRIFRRHELLKLHDNEIILHVSELDAYINDAQTVLLNLLPEKLNIGLVKDLDYLKNPDFIPARADWPKYERFLINNKICYSFFDIRSSQWMEEAQKFDIIIWHPFSSPASREEAETKIYIIQFFLKKKCYPSFEEMWGYENKVRSYYLNTYYRLPSVPTFVTNSENEALDYISRTSFPLISKIATGSASNGVIKLKNRNSALRFATACFSGNGRRTFWPYLRQKNYIYFQKFIGDAKYDLRVIVVGNKVFGYYRYARKNDFKASGTGILEKKELPEEAMRLAIETYKKYHTTSLAVDMLFSEEEKQYYIIETSIFFGIDTPEQLIVNGKPGYYEYTDQKFFFREGKYWIQELALQQFLSTRI